jgi:Rieske Fe-S protein
MDMNQIQEGETTAGDACAMCVAGTRRDFLREAAGLLGGALVGLGLSPERAHSFPLKTATPLDAAGDEITLAVPAQDGATVYKEHGLILARHSGAVYAFSLACPHQRAAIQWLGQRGRFQCTKHKSKYRPDGVYISGRATRSMDRFAIRREKLHLVVDLSQRLREDEDQTAWAAAVVWLDEK